MNLQNKVAWITGGARMGEGVAYVLSQKGCKIVLSYRTSKAPAEKIIQQLLDQGREAMAPSNAT